MLLAALQLPSGTSTPSLLLIIENERYLPIRSGANPNPSGVVTYVRPTYLPTYLGTYLPYMPD